MKYVLTGVLLLALAACGGESDASKEGDADSAVQRIEKQVAEVTEAIAITEDNDPNDLIGRPNGYESGVILRDERGECDELGVTCGAVLETWPDADAAQERSDYILGILEDSPALGSEYHYLDGATLLRVTGELTPSEAADYEAALSG